MKYLKIFLELGKLKKSKCAKNSLFPQTCSKYLPGKVIPSIALRIATAHNFARD